jgi:hypothetical protein
MAISLQALYTWVWRGTGRMRQIMQDHRARADWLRVSRCPVRWDRCRGQRSVEFRCILASQHEGLHQYGLKEAGTHGS